jgi:hypothetical protein
MNLLNFIAKTELKAEIILAEFLIQKDLKNIVEYNAD